MADPRFHDNQGPFSLGDIADHCGTTCPEDNRNFKIDDVSGLADSSLGQITFLDNIKYKSALPTSLASACILSKQMAEFAPKNMISLISENPYKSYALAAAMFYPLESVGTIHNSAVIGNDVTMGKNVTIEANTVIGDRVIIGDNVHIGSNVSITHAIIGHDVRVHNGTRIGQDGFGFALDESGCVHVPQLGRVIINDHVNIGANTCIDRGAGPDTIIGQGTIIDNLVQIAHNVQIGKGCVITAQVGISGSTKIGDYCVFGGQSGVSGHLEIGTGVQVGAQSGVTKNIEAGQKIMGFPARPIREYWREMARIKKLLSK